MQTQKEMVEGYRISPQQKHIWLLQQSDHAAAYNTRCAVLIEGGLDKGLLRAAVATVVERHEILRTTFCCLPGMVAPVQVINGSVVPVIEENDLGDLNSQESERGLHLRFNRAGEAPLLSATDSYMRLELIALSSDRHALIVSLPALCADAVGLRNIIREVIETYGAHSEGESIESEPLQYADLSEVQNDLLESEDMEVGREYWRRRDVSRLLGLKLPFEQSSAASRQFDPQYVCATVGPEMMAGVEDVSSRLGMSTSTFLLACWELLLWKLTGQSEIVIGAGHDCRNYEGLDEAVGLFAKYIPISLELDEATRFSDLAKLTDDLIREAGDWQEYFSWEQVSSGDVDMAAGPRFCPFAFEWMAAPEESIAAGLSFSIIKESSCIDRFKLKLACLRRANDLMAEFHYDASLLSDESVKRIASQFLCLIASAIGDTQSGVGGLEIVDEAERSRLLFEFNNTAMDYPGDKCVHELFQEQVERTPNNTAVAFGDETITYSELNTRSNQVANYLRRIGVGPDVLVGIYMERSTNLIVSLLGVLKAGGAYVPLEVGFPKDRLSFMLEDTRAGALLTTGVLKTQLPGFDGRVICVDSDWEDICAESKDDPINLTAPENLAYVIYTSGSTGEPKGVMVNHRGLTNYVSWCLKTYPVTKGNGTPIHTSISFDLTVTSLYPPLLAGQSVILLSEDQGVEALQTSFRTGCDFGVIKITPAHMDLLRRVLADEEIRGRAAAFVIGGEALREESLSFWRKNIPDAMLINEYGPTETVVGCSTYDASGRVSDCDTVPIGNPITNTQIYLLDLRLNPVAVGVKGEIYIGGEAVARGYLNRPDLTAARFIPDPFSHHPGSRLYRTSDIARRLPDGSLEYLGRSDHQVKVRGYRIELGEVESHLCAHEAVAEAVVEAREAEGGDKRLVAYVVGRGGKEPRASEMRSHLRQRLPEYMVPTAYVVMRAMPLTTNKKVDRGALPEVGEGRREQDYSYVGPRGEVEGALSKVWEQVLRVDRVGVYDNFFELGGDSILGIQIIARANQLGLRLTAKQIFEHRTVAELAAVAVPATRTLAEQGVVTGEVPLTPIQHWFFQQEFEDAHHFNYSSIFELREEVSAAQMRKVVAALLTHHDALRLCFRRKGHLWSQTLLPPSSHIPLIEVDLSEIAEADLPAQVERAATLVQSSISLDEGTLLRAALFDLGSGASQRLLVAIHHLAVDVVSWRVIVEDLYRGYEAARGGQEVRLAEKTTSYKRWAERLSQYAQEDEVRQEADYWVSLGRRTGEGDKASGKVPVDYEGGSNTQSSARSISEGLSEEETAELVSVVGKAYGTSVVEALMSAVAEAVGEWTGEREVVMEVEGHGREEVMEGVDVTRTVGWFTSLYPVVIEAGGAGEGVGEKLRRVKETVRGVPRRGMGYGVLRYLSEDEGMRERMEGVVRGEVSFNYLGQVVQREGGEETSIGVGKESAGEWRSGRCRRSHKLEVSGGVRGGRLVVGIGYSERVHRRETVERVCGEVMRNLRSFISHCKSDMPVVYTPSDFPEAALSQQELDDLLAELND